MFARNCAGILAASDFDAPNFRRKRQSSADKFLRKIIIGVFTAAVGFSAIAATAAAQVQTATYDGLSFNDAKHRGWYVRFWNGSCGELRGVFCMSGAPYWGEIMQRLLVNVPAERRAQIRTRLVVLGRTVGYEWAKENDIRRIDDSHIKRWTSALKKAGDVEPAVASIEAESRQLLGIAADPMRGYAGNR